MGSRIPSFVLEQVERMQQQKSYSPPATYGKCCPSVPNCPSDCKSSPLALLAAACKKLGRAESPLQPPRDTSDAPPAKKQKLFQPWNHVPSPPSPPSSYRQSYLTTPDVPDKFSLPPSPPLRSPSRLTPSPRASDFFFDPSPSSRSPSRQTAPVQVLSASSDLLAKNPSLLMRQETTRCSSTASSTHLSPPCSGCISGRCQATPTAPLTPPLSLKQRHRRLNMCRRLSPVDAVVVGVLTAWRRRTAPVSRSNTCVTLKAAAKFMARRVI